jgi:hypothetical protein
LNAVAILREVIEDFRSSDRFFKYKALVIFLWLFLSASSLGVGCTSGGASNPLEAKLVVSSDGSNQVYMVKNESETVWQDVELLVNGRYRATLTQLEAHGGNMTLTPVVLFEENGDRAPKGLVFDELKVIVANPEAQVTLLRGGAVVLER